MANLGEKFRLREEASSATSLVFRSASPDRLKERKRGLMETMPATMRTETARVRRSLKRGTGDQISG
jgi:hypothetical protein